MAAAVGDADRAAFPLLVSLGVADCYHQPRRRLFHVGDIEGDERGAAEAAGEAE